MPHRSEDGSTKTSELRVGPAMFVKMLREFGFPTLVAIAVALAWWYQASLARADREADKVRVEKRLRLMDAGIKELLDKEHLPIPRDED